MLAGQRGDSLRTLRLYKQILFVLFTSNSRDLEVILYIQETNDSNMKKHNKRLGGVQRMLSLDSRGRKSINFWTDPWVSNSPTLRNLKGIRDDSQQHYCRWLTIIHYPRPLSVRQEIKQIIISNISNPIDKSAKAKTTNEIFRTLLVYHNIKGKNNIIVLIFLLHLLRSQSSQVIPLNP